MWVEVIFSPEGSPRMFDEVLLGLENKEAGGMGRFGMVMSFLSLGGEFLRDEMKVVCLQHCLLTVFMHYTGRIQHP